MCWRDGAPGSAPASVLTLHLLSAGAPAVPAAAPAERPGLGPGISSAAHAASHGLLSFLLLRLTLRGHALFHHEGHPRGAASRAKPAAPCFLSGIGRGTQMWPPRCGDRMHPLRPGHLAAVCTATGVFGAASLWEVGRWRAQPPVLQTPLKSRPQGSQLLCHRRSPRTVQQAQRYPGTETGVREAEFPSSSEIPSAPRDEGPAGDPGGVATTLCSERSTPWMGRGQAAWNEVSGFLDTRPGPVGEDTPGAAPELTSRRRHRMGEDHPRWSPSTPSRAAQV